MTSTIKKSIIKSMRHPINNTFQDKIQAVSGLPYSTVACFVAAGILSGLCLAASPAAAADYFDPAALELKESSAAESDLRQFSTAGGQLPGIYLVDVYLNGNQVGTRDVTFVDDGGRLLPEFTPAELSAMGVKNEAFPLLNLMRQDQALSNLGELIPDADSRFDFSQQRLDVSIPQAALNIEARNAVNPALWDQGLTSARLNYSYSGANTDYGTGRSRSNFFNLRSGFNAGAWRLRNYSTYAGSGQKRASWQSISTYAQRDVQPLKGQLTLGDSATPGEVFDSVPFRGVQLVSDNNMLPDSLRGFAPVIRGIAQSNAQVTVRQNGYVIYQTYVAPGAFTITDLYPTASSGDLEVVIREADGSERVSLQPFSAVPIMQREGQLKYAATAGRYRTAYLSGNTPNFVQGTAIYGLPLSSTVYGGVQASGNYQSAALGLGHSFGHWGSVSMDATQAQATLRDDSTHRGQSFRFQYAKDIAATGTTFTLAGYRYSTSGFFSMQEANEVDVRQDEVWRLRYNKRSQAMLNLNQSLREYGSVYISASQQDYWQQTGSERNISAGYYLTHGGVNYGLNYTLSRTPGLGSEDRQLAFSVQIPLDRFMAGSWARYGLTRSKSGGTTHNAGLSGTALEDNNLNYRVQQRYDRRGQGYGGDLSGTYKGTYGEVSTGYNYASNARQVNYGAQGSVVVHPYGVTFGQATGETAVLVRAPGADGVRVENHTGVKTDWRGYSVVPYASTYRHNRIALDTGTYGEDMDIDTATSSVVPTKGALVLADFKTRTGSRVLVNLNRSAGPVPFGAMATLDGDAGNSGIVGDGGQVYLSGVPQSGRLNVSWGSGATQQCQAAFTLPAQTKQTVAVKIVTALCE